MVYSDLSSNNSNIQGFMPLKGQFGYVFNTDNRAIAAHELGHGIFGLEHPFANKSEERKTKFLMDYDNGLEIWHNDWKQINDPKFKLYLFQKDSQGEYETDGHYSTVYLVSLMLGMDPAKALELAIATEAPDTTVHNETKFELNDTWGHPFGPQQDIHSLTGGFHGIEEFFTAIKFLYTNKNDTKQLGELLHRFGDTYAHSKLNNLKPEDIKENLDLKNLDSLTIQKYIQSWKIESENSLKSEVKPWLKFFNYYLKEYGMDFLENERHQKLIFKGETLKEILRTVYLKNDSRDFVMYGKEGYTFDHAGSDGSYPDQIYIRPNWYLLYVQNLAWLIGEKFKLDPTKLNLSTFSKMTNFVTKNKCSMKGIIDYEISKFLNKKTFCVPLFYSAGRILALADETINSNYEKIAKDVVENSKKYLIEQGISPDKIQVTKTDRLVVKTYATSSSVKVSSTTEAYIITLKQ